MTAAGTETGRSPDYDDDAGGSRGIGAPSGNSRFGCIRWAARHSNRGSGGSLGSSGNLVISSSRSSSISGTRPASRASTISATASRSWITGILNRGGHPGFAVVTVTVTDRDHGSYAVPALQVTRHIQPVYFTGGLYARVATLHDPGDWAPGTATSQWCGLRAGGRPNDQKVGLLCRRCAVAQTPPALAIEFLIDEGRRVMLSIDGHRIFGASVT